MGNQVLPAQMERATALVIFMLVPLGNIMALPLPDCNRTSPSLASCSSSTSYGEGSLQEPECDGLCDNKAKDLYWFLRRGSAWIKVGLKLGSIAHRVTANLVGGGKMEPLDNSSYTENILLLPPNDASNGGVEGSGFLSNNDDTEGEDDYEYIDGANKMGKNLFCAKSY